MSSTRPLPPPYPPEPPGSGDKYKLKLRRRPDDSPYPRRPSDYPRRASEPERPPQSGSSDEPAPQQQPSGGSGSGGLFLVLLYGFAGILVLLGKAQYRENTCDFDCTYTPDCCVPAENPWFGPALLWLFAGLIVVLGTQAFIRGTRGADARHWLAIEPGWRPDPSRRYEQRYFGRTGWTDHVANISEKLQTRDPIPVDPKTGKTPSDH